MGSPEGTFDTSLHEAVRNGIVEEVQEALRQGYDPNLIGLFQWNPMHEATDNGDEDILKILIKKKGDPNKPDYIQGKTPMHYATEKGHIGCLKLLIDCGGRYDKKDESGKDCLDLCTPASRKMLERLKVRDLMLRPDAQSNHSDKDEISLHETSVDQNSIKSGVDSESASRRSSISISSLQEKQPVIGYLHLSVEYHSVNESLKIRIWQLTDILLPPPHTSGIHSIYVKSFLMPDKKKDTKRKTEDIRIDTSEAHVQWKNKSSHQHVFMPSTFKFKRPLEYQKINKEMVKDKTLQIEVCITQRYTHRSFLIGMLNMSLRKAVKKVVREKMTLIPCMNHTIPSNMKVYCASELDITSNKVFYSTPNVKVNIPEGLDGSSEKASSDPDLQPYKHSPSVEVDISKMVRATPNVPKLSLEDMTLDESGYSSEFHMSMPGELDSPDSDKMIVKRLNIIDSAKNVVKSLDGQGTVSKVLEGVKDKLTRKTRAVTKVANGVEVTDLDEEEPVSISVETDNESKNEVSIAIKGEGQTSRPDTPTWDYYDVPTEIVATDDAVGTLPQWKEGAAPVVLPMETSLSLHQSKDNITAKEMDSAKPKEKVRRKSKKKGTSAVPGRAMPLVPEIIVVNADDCNNKSTSRNLPETKLTMFDSDKQALPECADNHSVDVHHVVEIKDVKAVSEKGESKNSKSEQPFKEKLVVNNAGQARALCVIEPIETPDSNVNIEHSKHSLPIARPRTKKLTRKMREGGSKSGLSTQNRKYDQTGLADSIEDGRLVAQKFKPKQAGPGTATRILRDSTTSELSGITVTSSGSRSNTKSASVFVDMNELSFANSGSHVVELDDEISITELSDNSDLFSHSSVISSTSLNMEDSLESYKLPERVSPTKYMIPMQVYMEDDTSCDESISTDRSDRSYTAHSVRNTTSQV